MKPLSTIVREDREQEVLRSVGMAPSLWNNMDIKTLFKNTVHKINLVAAICKKK